MCSNFPLRTGRKSAFGGGCAICGLPTEALPALSAGGGVLTRHTDTLLMINNLRSSDPQQIRNKPATDPTQTGQVVPNGAMLTHLLRASRSQRQNRLWKVGAW